MKIRLDLENLDVQSFETGPAPSLSGTVFGHGTEGGSTCQATYCDDCNNTQGDQDTCDFNVCGYPAEDSINPLYCHSAGASACCSADDTIPEWAGGDCSRY